MSISYRNGDFRLYPYSLRTVAGVERWNPIQPP